MSVGERKRICGTSRRAFLKYYSANQSHTVSLGIHGRVIDREVAELGAEAQRRER